MKRTTIAIGLLAATSLIACKHKGPHHPPVCGSQSLIPKDSANKMINSYLNSINYPLDDSDVLSYSVDADALRFLLDSMPGSQNIHEIQIRLGHDLDYINSGHGNQNCGYNYKGLTVILNGVSLSGSAVVVANAVINHARPCPKSCPPGNASNPLY